MAGDMFTDISGLSQERRDAINKLAIAEIVKGIGGGQYGIFGDVSRTDMPLYLVRVLEWVELARDEIEDSTVFIMTFGPDNAMGGGSGWWRAPRVIITNRHVVRYQRTLADGTIEEGYNDFLVLAKGGWVRNNRFEPGSEPQMIPGISALPTDKRDIATLVVPESLWVQYLDRRTAAGLPREPHYLNPNESRELRGSELCMVCGSPLMEDYTVSSGTITRTERPKQGTDGEYFTTDAGINPGNSGGVCMTFDRKFAGMPTLKPWYRSPWGSYYVPADDMGYVLHWRTILGWEKSMAWWFTANGIIL